MYTKAWKLKSNASKCGNTTEASNHTITGGNAMAVANRIMYGYLKPNPLSANAFASLSLSHRLVVPEVQNAA